MPGTPLILVVDDTPKITMFLEELLHHSGFRTISAGDGADGLEIANRIQPDLVILDLRLPKIDGFTVLKELRSNPKTHKIPVIVLSGTDVVSDVDKAYARGANDYVIKPYDNNRLVAKIRKHLPQSMA